MAKTHIDQSGSTAGGNIAAGDINTTNIVIPTTPSPLQSLLERIDKERDADPEFNALIDILQHFSESAYEGAPLGLKKKLEDGSRTDLVVQATREKEIFAKQLSKHQHSESAQNVYAYLLGVVKDRFVQHITPMLQNDVPLEQIDTAIVNHIINPCIAELLHNPLAISSVHLHGMIYFLTGNCYIKWMKDN